MKKFIAILAAVFVFGFPFLGTPEAEASSAGQLIVINKATNKLAFFNNGKLVKTFPVATGKTLTLTPEGKFPIVNKIKNRPYYTDNIPGGDPRNPLGDRWLGLNARGTYGTTYAIHGNNNAGSIGKYVSAGCVRMNNSDIHWLFDQVNLHTNVVIVNSSKTMEQIASDNGYQTLPPIKIMLDGKAMSVSNPPIKTNDRVLVPMRSVFNALGATVVWNGKTQSITASKDGKRIELKINSKKATVDGKSYTLDVAPTINNGQTFVPTLFVSEALGAQVKWDGKKRTVLITSPPKAPPAPPEPVKTPLQVTLNSQAVVGDAFMLEGVSMVSVRDVFDWLGVPFSYDAGTGTVKAWSERGSILVTRGNKTATINGSQHVLPAAPLVHQGKLYVPVRAITEAFGGYVKLEGTQLHLTIQE